ncbi:hypothetical protein BGZ76_011001 [Entomortierella beljakovae]|nr:hypothetical protein BGZ76_011001 [Entomortierella beljakovae]
MSSDETEFHNSTNFDQSLQIIKSLWPLALQVMEALKEHDPRLDNFSTRTSGFIFEYNPAFSSIDDELQKVVSNPEAIRQLGRVILLSIISILEGLIPTSQHVGSVSDQYHINKRDVKKLRSIIAIAHEFARPWVGPNTLKSIIKIYGEDDAGISWLLITMSKIERQIRNLQSIYFGSLPHSIHLGEKENEHGEEEGEEDEEEKLLEKEFNSLYSHLHRYVHPLEALFYFLETIGYDYQTLLDLLLTLDDHQSGGMLAAVMTTLRSFTELKSDQEKIIERWKQLVADEIADHSAEDVYQSHINPEIMSDDEDGSALLHSDTRTRLLSIELCISKLTNQIRLLHSKGLFPYNPRALLVVLDYTHEILLQVSI